MPLYNKNEMRIIFCCLLFACDACDANDAIDDNDDDVCMCSIHIICIQNHCQAISN